MLKTSGFLVCFLLGVTSISLPACGGSNSNGGGSSGNGSSGNGSSGNGSSGNGSSGSSDNGGAPSSADQCTAFYTAECGKVYECLTADEVASTNGEFGTSKADCPAALETQFSCDSLTMCKPGETYQAAKFSECSNAISALSCTTFLDANANLPAACSEICKADSVGSGGAGLGGSGPGDGSMDGITECKKLYATECGLIFMCFTPDQLAMAGSSLGTTPDECAANLEADTPCVQDQCQGSGTFDGAQAEKCLTAYKALTCDQFNASQDPAECATVCK